MMFVDKDGVPQIVQRVRFLAYRQLWEVTYFDGREVLIEPFAATPNLALFQAPREAEYKDAAAYAERNYYPMFGRIQRVK